FLLDTDATISTDPGATIAVAGPFDGQNYTSKAASQATNVLLLGQIVDHSGTVAISAQRTWLGPRALIDLSGIFVPSSQFGFDGATRLSGTLLDGGILSIGPIAATSSDSKNPNRSGTYVVSQPGAVVDVSGAPATTFEVWNGSASLGGTSTVTGWSNAGTVLIETAAFAWGGTFKADTDPRATGGGTFVLGGAAIAEVSVGSVTK
ncbi:hypothetical protein, partial [Rhodoplanes sp. SY1]|uniref:hypothetical protein n=1 Tax=Rhodoplanes sp. SY1 TaxID=3166646 RepID=UPI0038B505FA